MKQVITLKVERELNADDISYFKTLSTAEVAGATERIKNEVIRIFRSEGGIGETEFKELSVIFTEVSDGSE